MLCIAGALSQEWKLKSGNKRPVEASRRNRQFVLFCDTGLRDSTRATFERTS